MQYSQVKQFYFNFYFIGLGADKSNVDNWLGHQQAFDSLLAELNQASNSDGKNK